MTIGMSQEAQRQFIQHVPEHGFTIEEVDVPMDASPFPGRQKIIVPKFGADFDTSFRIYSPMDAEPVLFRKFAAVDQTSPEAILSFVSRWGFLEVDPLSYTRRLLRTKEGLQACPFSTEYSYSWYETVEEIRRHIIRVRIDVLLIDAIKNRDPYELAWLAAIWGSQALDVVGAFGVDDLPSMGLMMDEGEVPYIEHISRLRARGCPVQDVEVSLPYVHDFLAWELRLGLSGAVKTFVDVGTPERPRNPSLQLQPAHLMAAMYLQMAQDFTGERSFRKCLSCDTWFELGTDAKTKRALYCSANCRQRYFQKMRRKRADQREHSD